MSVSNLAVSRYVPEFSGLVNVTSVTNAVVVYYSVGPITYYSLSATVADVGAGTSAIYMSLPNIYITDDLTVVASGTKPQTSVVPSVQVVPDGAGVTIIWKASNAITSQLSLLMTIRDP